MGPKTKQGASLQSGGELKQRQTWGRMPREDAVMLLQAKELPEVRSQTLPRVFRGRLAGLTPRSLLFELLSLWYFALGALAN